MGFSEVVSMVLILKNGAHVPDGSLALLCRGEDGPYRKRSIPQICDSFTLQILTIIIRY